MRSLIDEITKLMSIKTQEEEKALKVIKKFEGVLQGHCGFDNLPSESE